MIRNYRSIGKRPILDTPFQLIHAKKGSLMPFRKGEVFEGLVLKRSNSGRVTISAKGKIFDARAMGSISSPRKYKFKVTRTTPNVEISVIREDRVENRPIFQVWAITERGRNNFSSTIRKILSFVSSLEHVFDANWLSSNDIQSLLNLWICDGNSVRDMRWLINSLVASGLFLENKLWRIVRGECKQPQYELVNRDLKAVLLRILDSLTRADDQNRKTDALVQDVLSALHLIETHQAMNLQFAENNIGWFWFIPMSDDGNPAGAEILTKRSSSGVYNVWVRITLSQLGHVGALLTLEGGRVQVTIFMEDEYLVKFASKRVNALKKGLDSQGLLAHSIEFKLSRGDELAFHLAREVDKCPEILDVMV